MMVHLPKVFSGKSNKQDKQQRVSGVTAGIVNRILDTQLPSIMKTMSPRRITGLNSHNGFLVPKIEHVQEVAYDKYTVGAHKNSADAVAADNQSHSSAYTQFQVKTPEYICFINHSEPEIEEKSFKNTPGWGGRKRKAPPPRVKSMDELLLEESMRRNSRSLVRVPDLRVKGDYAPGYQCKWERLKHLPDIKPAKQTFERQPTVAESFNLYKDADASFSQNRVDEILKSEGFLFPDSGFGFGQSFIEGNPASSSARPLHNIKPHDEFLSEQMIGNRCFRLPSQPKMFSISASRVDSQLKNSQSHSHRNTGRSVKSSVGTGESLAILQTRKRLPNLIINPIGKVKPD